MERTRKQHLSNTAYASYLQDYREYASNLGYAYHSQRRKSFLLHDFLQWLTERNINDITKIAPSHLKEYHEHLKNRPCKTKEGVLKSNTIQQHFSSIRLFFILLQETQIIVKNPMSVIKITCKREKSFPKSILTIPEVMELYRYTETLLERAFLSLCYGCGMRGMEVTAVNMEDLRLNENYIIIPHGKGNKKRLVPISQRIRRDIEQYIDYERTLYMKDERQKALLLNTSGERIRSYTFAKMLYRIIERTGNKEIIRKKICPHNLRHSIATHLLEQGVTIEQVRNFLGHSLLETTEIYTRVSQKQLKTLL